MNRVGEHADRLDRAIDIILKDDRGPVVLGEDPLVSTARVLQRSLPRLRPSLGFEEHLAARLAAARRMELAPAGATARRPMTPTPIRADLTIEPPTEVDVMHDRRRRQLMAGGAIASGVSIALPIAGAAYVAWRRSRSSGGLL